MISDIVKNDLCTGCGTCFAVCPHDAIQMTIEKKAGVYNPVIDTLKCTKCKICYNVCPGQTLDFKELNDKIFHKKIEDNVIGNFSHCYVGYSRDEKIRYGGASGGLITQILVQALEDGIICGALVTRMDKDNPLIATPFIARTKEEILESTGSKYCPVPANTALKELVKLKEKGTIAVVGLPCHIQGLRKAELKKIIHCDLLYLGIFCGHTPNFNATLWMLNNYGVKASDIKKIEYRGNGWPGGMTITMNDNIKKFIQYANYWNSGFGQYFFPKRCTLCYDGTAEFADISFGDAWLPEFKSDHEGTSMIISRSQPGDRLLEKCQKTILLREIDPDKAIQSQSNMLEYKKNGYHARKRIAKLLNKNVPIYNETDKMPSLGNYISAISVYFSLWLAREKLWPLLRIHKLSVKGMDFLDKKIKKIWK